MAMPRTSLAWNLVSNLVPVNIIDRTKKPLIEYLVHVNGKVFPMRN
jgi:hypothetical protein